MDGYYPSRRILLKPHFKITRATDTSYVIIASSKYNGIAVQGTHEELYRIYLESRRLNGWAEVCSLIVR